MLFLSLEHFTSLPLSVLMRSVPSYQQDAHALLAEREFARQIKQPINRDKVVLCAERVFVQASYQSNQWAVADIDNSHFKYAYIRAEC